MVKRVLLGTIAGAITIFFVSFAWHMTPIAETGITNLPHEEVLGAAMKLAISEPGWYMFPGIDVSKQNDPAEQKRYLAAFVKGPTGLVIYHPGGTEFSFAKLLVNQFVFGAGAALVISCLLAMAANSLPGFGARVLFVALVAAFGAFTTDLPYWNWYGFPGNYTVAHLAGIVLTWAVTGCALAAIVKPQKA
jgi:hypothetical protein